MPEPRGCVSAQVHDRAYDCPVAISSSFIRACHYDAHAFIANLELHEEWHPRILNPQSQVHTMTQRRAPIFVCDRASQPRPESPVHLCRALPKTLKHNPTIFHNIPGRKVFEHCPFQRVVHETATTCNGHDPTFQYELNSALRKRVSKVIAPTDVCSSSSVAL